MLLATLLDFGRQTAATVSSHPPTMPLLNLSLVTGGFVAALLVVSKYPVRRTDTPRARASVRAMAFALTMPPGVIVAQVAYDAAVFKWPSLRQVESMPLGVGLLLGGIGQPLVMALYKRLPSVLTDRAIGFLSPKPEKTNENETD